MDRVAFRSNMEATNLFLTSLIFFCAFVVITILCVAIFKGFCELAVKYQWMKSEKFQDFRDGWLVILKGIMFRTVLIGFPQMTILCFWEFTRVDSPAEVVLAVFFFLGMAATSADMGGFQGGRDREEIGADAQEPDIHPLLGPYCFL
jgi:hypothetical protein